MAIPIGGYSELPNIGTLAYNGVEFDVLCTSNVSAFQILDEAGRVVKYIAYTITVDGYVTLNGAESSIDLTFSKLRQALQKQGCTLTYSGKGFGKPFVVNAPGGALKDVANGPIPKILDFQPLGGSPMLGMRAAKIRWQVTTHVPEAVAKIGMPVLQFNWDSSVTYDMDGYSSLSFKGTIEAPIAPLTPGGKEIGETVDSYRKYVDRVVAEIDLTRFKITNRVMNISRDKRTMTFDIKADELGPMANPAGIYTAKGNFACRSAKTGSGAASALAQWMCTLRCTYVVPKGRPQRLAWKAFVTLLAERMFASQNSANMPQNPDATNPPPEPPPTPGVLQWIARAAIASVPGGNFVTPIQTSPPVRESQIRTFVTSFEFDEGLYEDSRTVSFSCTWLLVCPFRWVLRATGWRQMQTGTAENPGLCNPTVWAQSIRSISGSKSWLVNKLDPNACAIVDFGS